MSHPITSHDPTERRHSDDDSSSPVIKPKMKYRPGSLRKSIAGLADSVVKHDKLVRGKPGWDLFKRSYSAKDKAMKSKLKDLKVRSDHDAKHMHSSDDTRGE